MYLKTDLEKREHIYIISVNAISSIPLTRYIADFYNGSHQVTIIDTYIKKANSYFQNMKGLRIWPLIEYNEYDTYYKNIGKKTYKRYIKLLLRLICIIPKSKSIIYSSDYQVMALVIILNKFWPKKHKIIYHQYEVIVENKLGKLSHFLYGIFSKNRNTIDLFIFPEINREDYFLKKNPVDNGKLFLFPNTCDVKKEKFSSKALNSIPIGNKVCLHVGAVGGINHYFEEYLEAIKQIELINKKISFLFIGRFSDKIKEQLHNLKVSNLIILPFVPHEELKEIYQNTDIGIILYKGPGINYEYCAPNKLYEFWSYGIPVFAHKLKGLIPLFIETSQGRLIDFSNKEEIVNELLNLSEIVNDTKELKEYFSRNFEVALFLKDLNKAIQELN